MADAEAGVAGIRGVGDFGVEVFGELVRAVGFAGGGVSGDED